MDGKKRNKKRPRSQSPSNDQDTPVVWVLDNLKGADDAHKALNWELRKNYKQINQKPAIY